MTIERVLTPEHPAWSRSYPQIRDPRPGESLAGFMLGLDDLNGFGAGQTYRVVRRHGNGPANVGPGYFINGTCFDLGQLAALAGGLPIEAMLALTARALGEWLFADRKGASNTYAPAPMFKVCPECIAASDLPLLFLFEQVTVCPQHRRELLSTCDGAPIRPFQRQDPGRCDAYPCERWYRDIPAKQVDPVASPEPFRYAAAYADLLAFAASRPDPLTTTELVVGLRMLINRGRVHANRLQTRMNKNMVSLRTIADVLVRFSATAADLDAACRLVPGSSSSAVPLRSRPGECPNPACASGSKVLKDGQVVHTGERQFVCRSCGTRFSDSGVLFAFVPLDGYPRWRAQANAEKLDRFRAAVTAACASKQQLGVYLSLEFVLAHAGVPTSAPYQSDYAGLRALVAASNSAAGAKGWR